MWFGTLQEGSVEKRMHEVIQRTARTWLGREKKGILRVRRVGKRAQK